MPRLEDLRIKKPSETPPNLQKRPELPDLRPPAEEETETKYASVYESVGGRPRRPLGLWVVAVSSVLVLLFALSFLFTKAKIAVTPKIVEENLNETISASKTSAGAADNLTFDLVVLEGEESKGVEAGAERDVSVAATGRAVIYNTYSSAPQSLAIDTRLEGSNGKIYKTKTRLTVPGKRADGTPGSVEVAIYASEPGPEYNSGPLDFKIFGFKGTPKYGGFYARSTGDLTGGFVGKTREISPEDRERTVAELRIGLQSKLYKRASDQLPEGFVMWKDGSTLSILPENIRVVGTETGADVTVKGTFTGIIIDESKLAKKIAELTVPKYNGEEVFIPEVDNLNFSLTGLSIPLAEAENIVFSLSGPAEIVYLVDVEALGADVLGKKKRDLNQILQAYPAIASADLVLRPFWKTSFPDKPESIQITVDYPK